MRLLKLETILAATDCTATSDAALSAAARLAAAAHAELHVVHVTSSAEETHAPYMRDKVVSEIQDTLERLGAEGVFEIDVVLGQHTESITRAADRIDADLIVLGRGGRRQGSSAPKTQAVGSTAYAVLTRSDRPCMVVRNPLKLPLQRALVAVDASESARGALLVGLSWASALRPRGRGARPTTLTALHVAAEQREEPRGVTRLVDVEIEHVRELAGDWAGVSVESVTLDAPAVAPSIARYVDDRDYDLIVLGTRAKQETGGRRTRLGSVAAAITLQVDVPVLLVPPALWRAWSADLDAVDSARQS